MKRSLMTPMLFAVFTSLFLLLIEGCKTTNQVWMPTHEQLIAMDGASQQLDAESLRRGRILTVTECVSCHRQFWPNEYSEKKWPSILLQMGKRASLDDGQIKDLINYHVAASRASLSRERMNNNVEQSM